MLAVSMDYLPRIKLMGLVAYRTPWIHFKRNTDEFIWYFIKSGELHLRENGIDYSLKKGDLLLLEPHLEHEGTSKSVCEYYYVHFTHSSIWRQPLQDALTIAKLMFLEGDSPDPDRDQTDMYVPKQFALPLKSGFQRTVHAMNELLQLHKRRQWNRSMTALKFTELLAETSREHWLQALQQDTIGHTKSFMKVHALLDYIQGHYTEKITGADIEARFECSFDYINRVFRSITGHTIIRYINMIRIRRAAELIEATPLNFGEIGYLVGLDDPFYFSKVFKQYMGLSPKQFDAKIKEKGALKAPGRSL